MSRLYSSFEFLGNIHVPQDVNKFHDVNTSERGWGGHRLNFRIYGGFSKAKQNLVKGQKTKKDQS